LENKPVVDDSTTTSLISEPDRILIAKLNSGKPMYNREIAEPENYECLSKQTFEFEYNL